MPDEDKLYRDNMTAEEKQDAHKNLMSYSDDFSIDIPPRQNFFNFNKFLVAGIFLTLSKLF